jgi:transcriptional regulator with XRE-family HTH domain
VARGKASPSVASRQRLAGALGMAVSDLFSLDGTKQPGCCVAATGSRSRSGDSA